MRGALLVLCALGSRALADPPSEDISEYTFHEHQFGLSARIGLAYRALFTKDPTTYCGQTDPNAQDGNANPCTGRTPLALDLEPSYAVTRGVEVLLEVRVGVERDFGQTPTSNDGPYLFHLAPGARVFFSEAKHVKMFVQPMMVFDLSAYKASGFDLGARVLEGVWIDVHRTYGFYLYLGETAELLKFFAGSRWLDAEMEGGFGFQVRYP